MRRAFLLAAVAIIAVISGCQQSEKAPSTATPFIGGTSALLINFVENAPPAEITDKNGDETFPFNVIVTVENVGEHTIGKFWPADYEKVETSMEETGEPLVYDEVYTVPTDATVGYKGVRVNVTLSGIFPDDFGITETQLWQTLKKRLNGAIKDTEGNKIPGDIDQVTFPEMAYDKTLLGNLQLPFQADVCYQYNTTAIGQYCTRKNELDTKESVCEPNGIKQMHSSGGQVQVDSMTESAAGKTTIILTFKIKHFGNGKVQRPYENDAKQGDFYKTTFVPGKFEPGKMNSGKPNPYHWACSKKTHIGDDNKVYVEINPGTLEEGTEFKCLGFAEPVADETGKRSQKEGYVKLKNNEAILTCKMKATGTDAIDAVRTIEIDMIYDYRETISKNILIKHLLE